MCYIPVPDGRSIFEAMNTCLMKGGYLAAPKNNAMTALDAIFNTIPDLRTIRPFGCFETSNYLWWTSLRDVFLNGHFLGGSGHVIQQAFWDTYPLDGVSIDNSTYILWNASMNSWERKSEETNCYTDSRDPGDSQLALYPAICERGNGKLYSSLPGIYRFNQVPQVI
jgi:hypothetical protein